MGVRPVNRIKPFSFRLEWGRSSLQVFGRFLLAAFQSFQVSLTFLRAPPTPVRSKVEPRAPFFVARRRGTNETDAPKQSKSTQRRRELPTRRRAVRSEKASFPSGQTSPLFSVRRFLERIAPALFKMVNATGYGPVVVGSARLCCVVLGRRQRNAFLPHKSYTFIFSAEGTRGDRPRPEGGRERDPCTRHPPTRYAGPPPALPRPLSR